jgi:molybdopterin-guanine dinucleotide biosynthesis protein B
MNSEVQNTTPPIVLIVGRSDSGKTTLLERLIPELRVRGYRVGTIKRAHSFDIDHEGKDSWRHKHAGAHSVAVSSQNKLALIKDVETEETLDNIALRYFRDVQIILAEGYKREKRPKIEVYRSEAHAKSVCEGDEHLVAFVSDSGLDLGVPCFGLDDVQGLADFVEEKFLLSS